MTRGLKITAVAIMTIIMVNDHGHTWYRRERGSEESWPAGWSWWSCPAPAEHRRPSVFRGLPTWGKASYAPLQKSFLTISCVRLLSNQREVANKVQVLKNLTPCPWPWDGQLSSQHYPPRNYHCPPRSHSPRQRCIYHAIDEHFARLIICYIIMC